MNDADSHQKFTEENKLNFPLLVDTNKNLAFLFGAAEKSKERLNRLTVIIDKAGKIVKIDKEVNPTTHGSDIVEFFKISDTPRIN